MNGASGGFLSAALAGLLLLGGEEGGEFFVEGEEEGDALGLAGEVGFAVCGVNGAIKCVVSIDEIGGHGEWVVEIGEGGVGMTGTLVKDGLSGGLDGGALLVGGLRPREVVIDEAPCVPVVALEATANRSGPCHVHSGSENPKHV